MLSSRLTLCMQGKFACLFMSNADLFQNQHFFYKFLSGIPSEFETIGTQIRPDVLYGLIWVQSLCKVYQQTTLVGKGLKIYKQSEQFSCSDRYSMSFVLVINFKMPQIKEIMTRTSFVLMRFKHES